MIFFDPPNGPLYMNPDFCNHFGLLNLSCRKLASTLQKGGRLRLTFFFLSRSSISNPLSAITESPASTKSSIPEHLVISLSDIAPVYKEETNIIAPYGKIPITPLRVVLLLYEEYKRRDDGVSAKISVQHV